MGDVLKTDETHVAEMQESEQLLTFRLGVEVMHTNFYGEGNEESEVYFCRIYKMKDGRFKLAIGTLFHEHYYESDTCEGLLSIANSLKVCKKEQCRTHKREILQEGMDFGGR